MTELLLSPVSATINLWKYKELIWVSTKREVQGRYRGSMLGIFWSFVNPLMMLSVYTFVFAEIFRAKWGQSSGSKTEYALILFIGLIIFNYFSECISRAPNIIVNNVNYVKKVIFPLEILPVITALSALYHAILGFTVWLIAYAIFFGLPKLTILLAPLVILPLVFVTLGLSWVLASLGVFVRDIAQSIGVALTMLMFLSPIFYPASALPSPYNTLLFLNPLTIVVEQARDVMFWGILPNTKTMIIYWLGSLIFCWLGYLWFQKTRKAFADVL